MKLNRRKALIGIGSLAVGSGAALGSGAFTTVEANRDVTVQTASDNFAALGISSSNNYVTEQDDTTNALNFDITGGDNADGLNDDAVTTIDNLLTLTNQADSGTTVVSLASSGSWTTGGFNTSSGASNATGSASVTVPVPKDASSTPDAEVVFTLPDADANGNPGFELARPANSGNSTQINATIRTGSEIQNGPYNSGDDEDLVILAEE